MQSYHNWRKATNIDFTYTQWCTELNLGSKTTLRFLLQRKRRISSAVAKALKYNLSLDLNEQEYFEYLLIFSQPKSPAERTSAGAKLIQLQRRLFHQKEFDESIASIDAVGPIILTLLTFKDFHATELTIADFLNISLKDVYRIMQFYVDQGKVRFQNNTYSIDVDSFKVKDLPNSKSLEHFHKYWLDQSQKAFLLDFKLRRFRSLNFALSEEEFQSCLEKINDFAFSILSQHNNTHLEGRRLYMFESVLFPVSKKHDSPIKNQLKPEIKPEVS